MTLLSRGALAAVLLAAACGGGGGTGATKPGPTGGISGGGGAPAPGQEAGAPPIRGGGGGAFGGGNDPDSGGPAEDAAPVTGDGSVVADAGRDLAGDPPRDSSLMLADAKVTADTAPQPDTGSDPSPCGTGGVCDKLEDDFRAAVTRARSCNPLVKLQCQMTSASGLSCPGCKVWVNSNVELNAIRTMWTDAGCQVCRRICPAIACRAITTGICHSKMLAAPPEPDPDDPPGDRIILPPMMTGTCIDQSDPVPF